MADRLTVQRFLTHSGRRKSVRSLIRQRCARALTRGCERFVPAIPSWSAGRSSTWKAPISRRSTNCRTAELPNVQDLVRDGYTGTVNPRGYDDTYTMDEWFGDFAGQWVLNDTPHIRATMLEQLSAGRAWKSPELWNAYKKATRTSRDSWLRRLMGRH